MSWLKRLMGLIRNCRSRQKSESLCKKMKPMKSIYPMYLKVGLIMALFIIVIAKCQAQEVIITKKNGDKIEKRVQGTSSNDIYYQGGSVALSEIDNVYIKTEGKVAENFAAYLTKNGIAVSKVEPAKVEVKQSVVVVPVVPIQETTSLDQSIERFRAQRQTAKSLLVIGSILTSGAIALQSIYNKKYMNDLEEWNKKPTATIPQPKNVDPIFTIIGGSALVVGFAIDFDAGNRLRKH